MKGTQGILIVKGDDEFTKPKHQWDIRVQGKDNDTVSLEVSDNVQQSPLFGGRYPATFKILLQPACRINPCENE